MDRNYDIAQAGKSLARYMEERMNDERSSLQLLNMFEDEEADPFTVMDFGHLGRLVFKEEQADNHIDAGVEAPTPAEVVVAIQGIVTAKELPPFKGRFSPSKMAFLRQAVTLAILEEDAVDAVLEQIGRVQSVFKRHYGDRLQDECTFTTGVVGQANYTTFDISNRLFKKRADGDNDYIRDLGRYVDPDGSLGAVAAGNGYIHTADNEVHFFERKKDMVKGDHRFVTAEPTIYQVGDIVEVQFSFVALPLHQRKTKMALILRSIGLMDAQYAKACAMDKFKAAAKAMNAKRSSLKRSIGYTEENMSIAQYRMSDMDVDEGRRGIRRKEPERRGDRDASKTVDKEGRTDKRPREDEERNSRP